MTMGPWVALGVIGLLMLAGCVYAQADRGSAAPSSPEGAAPPPIPGQPGLPQAVELTRSALYESAQSGDVTRLTTMLKSRHGLDVFGASEPEDARRRFAAWWAEDPLARGRAIVEAILSPPEQVHMARPSGGERLAFRWQGAGVGVRLNDEGEWEGLGYPQ